MLKRFSYAFDMVDFSRIDGFPVYEVHDNVSYASIIMNTVFQLIEA